MACCPLFKVTDCDLIPSSLPPGAYRLFLWLPDAAEIIRARSEYAVRLANDGVWDEILGANVLGSIHVD